MSFDVEVPRGVEGTTRSPGGTSGVMLPVLLLAGAGIGLWWQGPWSALLLGVAALAWRRTVRGHLATVAKSSVPWVLLAAALCSGGAWWWPTLTQPSTASLTARLEQSYESVWTDLKRHCTVAAEDLPALREASRPELFGRLSSRLQSTRERLDFLLLDPTGEALAWAGEGLLHDVESLPDAGFSYRSSLTAVTLFATQKIADGDRQYSLVAGQSLVHSSWPFGGVRLDEGVEWWLGAAGDFDQGAPNLSGAGEILEIASRGAPSLYLAVDSLRWRPSILANLFQPLAWLLWALALMLARRNLTLAGRQGQSEFGQSLWQGALLTLAVLGLGQGFSLGTTVSWILAVASGLAAWGIERFGHRTIGGSSSAVLWLRGGLAGTAILLACGLLRRVFDAPDLAAGLLTDGVAVGLRLALGLFSLGVLSLLSSPRGTALKGPWIWGAMVLLLSAAATHDHTWLGSLLLVLGAAVTVRWAAGEQERWRASVFGLLLLVAALASGNAWEIVHRYDLRERLATDYLTKIAPPDRDEMNDQLIALEAHFAAQLASVTRPGGPGGDLQDLAFILWRQSPLAANDGLSALVVEPTFGDVSSFAFGLSLDAELEVVLDPARWRVPPVAAWQHSMLWGEAILGGPDAAWGKVRYAFLPRPGFRLGVSEVEELETYLVQGEGHRKYIDGLPRPALFGLYDDSGRALASPWREAPPLPEEGLDDSTDHGQLDTLSGRSWFWKVEGDEGIRVLFLPVIGPLDGLERVGILALGTLLSLALVGALILSLVWPVATFQQLVERTLSSYARRLILVYTVLLLVPLIALNLVLVGSFERRLIDEQRAKAQKAISSARVFLIDYLQGLDPGFGIDTQIDRTLMEWISQVVQHQVNLYWGSRIYASSQQELFTAGLLPQRIPGEIFSRLAYRGYEIGERRPQRDKDSSYLELYSPLDVPGLSLSEQGLFLSVPLLEQDKDVDRELATFRRRALLVSSGLFLLLVAVGSRLAHSFTKPIMTLIQGTRQIAQGATSLPWRPREEELSSLAAAIDDMAGSLAEGRRRLLREKDLVEQIVENITSGVVSVDRQQRVLLHNRVAAELLGTVVGDELHGSVEQSPRLASVSEKLEADPLQEWQATLRIRGSEDEARDWNLMWLPLSGDDPAALLVVDDVTEVLRGQRLSAWAEMARIIAHEIKNPLTPIRLSTEHMQQVYREDREQFDQVFERCADNILVQVEELRDIASDFSIYSRIPKAELIEDDLSLAVDELLLGYGDTVRTLGVEIVVSLQPRPLHLRFDRKLLGRAIRNLIENALRANSGQGRIELEVQGSAEEVTVSVSDRGPGVEAGNLERIFEPYFSTHESGTGLGLAITRRIIEEHGGHIEARNRPQGGLIVIMHLPAKERAEGDLS